MEAVVAIAGVSDFYGDAGLRRVGFAHAVGRIATSSERVGRAHPTNQPGSGGIGAAMKAVG